MFTEKEITYLKSQPLARIATVSPDLQPDVAPVSYQFDGKHFFIGGFDIARTFKYKNIKAGNANVSLVIDDLASVSPWVARGVKVHGTAKIVEVKGREVLVITPDRHWSWGIEAEAFLEGKPVSRKVKHEHQEAT
jgi:pyridoxamine 5'-phosphate oxidase family protein